MTRSNERSHLPMILAVPLLVLSFDSASVRLHAVAADLFISEYIEGSSNNKAIEIYNGTGAPIDLSAAGYNIQMYFNGSSSPGLTISLNGTITPGDVFVLAQTTANPAIIAQADQLSSAGWYNGNDAVVLARFRRRTRSAGRACHSFSRRSRARW